MESRAMLDPPSGEDSPEEDVLADNSQYPTMFPLFHSAEGVEQPGERQHQPNEQLPPFVDPLGATGASTNDGDLDISWGPTAGIGTMTGNADQVQNFDHAFPNLLLQHGSSFDDTTFINQSPAFATTLPTAPPTDLDNVDPVVAAATGGSSLLDSPTRIGTDDLPVAQQPIPGGALDESTAPAVPLPPPIPAPAQENPPSIATVGGDITRAQRLLMIGHVSRQNELLRQQLLWMQVQSYQHAMMTLLQQQQPLHMPAMQPAAVLLPSMPAMQLTAAGLVPPISAGDAQQVAGAAAGANSAVAAAPPARRRSTGVHSQSGGDQASTTVSATNPARPAVSRASRLYYDGSSKPKRPRSAYNFFFKDERVRLLDQREEEQRQQQPQHGAAAEPRTHRRRRRPGVIGSEEMGREIGRRWKQIDPQRKLQYEQWAVEDRARYQRQLAVYHNRKREYDVSSSQQP